MPEFGNWVHNLKINRNHKFVKLEQPAVVSGVESPHPTHENRKCSDM